MKFILPMPPSINQTYGVNRGKAEPLYKKPKVREWENEAGWIVKQQLMHESVRTYYKDVYMYVDFHCKIDRDIDAGIKVLLDLFQKQGIYLNDIQIIKLVVTKVKDLLNHGAEVLISDHELY